MSRSIWDRIEESRRRWNVLEHPFYRRWSAGELSREELARYSGQYRHAVQAIADLSRRAADHAPEDATLAGHAAEEEAHVALWDGFVDSVGGDHAATPTPETAECVERWTDADDLAGALARLYAIESGQPAISRTKLDGLREHYGVTDSDGIRYFTVHERRDAEHAGEARELIGEPANERQADAVVAAAEEAFRANWRLLDGV